MNSASPQTKPGSCLAPLQRDRQTKRPGFCVSGLPGYFLSQALEFFGPKGKLKLILGSDGYFRVNLRLKSKKVVRLAHRLIAQQFIPNPNNLPEVNHINGIKTDNRIHNLEWVTHQRNVKHSYEIGLRAGMVGERHPLTTFDPLAVQIIREAWPKFTQQEIANYFLVDRSTISKIVTRVNWNYG